MNNVSKFFYITVLNFGAILGEKKYLGVVVLLDLIFECKLYLKLIAQFRKGLG